jgi:hypothetical protein
LTNKTLDFDGYLAPFLLGGYKALCSQVNVQISDTPLKYQGVVGDCPSVFDKCSLDRIMINVFGGHKLPPLSLQFRV